MYYHTYTHRTTKYSLIRIGNSSRKVLTDMHTDKTLSQRHVQYREKGFSVKKKRKRNKIKQKENNNTRV